MTTFVLIHGGGDVGWSWHLVRKELESRGHRVVAPDLPADDDALTLDDYAAAVVDAVEARENVVVVGHSFGGFTAPLVAERLSADVLVLLAGMIPAPGESPDQWWANTGFARAVRAQAALDGGLTGNEDPLVGFYHDVPRGLAEDAVSRERAHPSSAAMAAVWPAASWPAVLTRVLICTDDRFFPAGFMRRVSEERLGIVPDEIAGSHCVMLSRPVEVAERLIGYASGPRA
ncbi:alpha/beta hydrolase [Microbacterium saperdae]|uniref:Alpha/beta hydrolase family protein n=1 Tax=Microbacterium saperdae TaxID=69368 RepID=A0A543BNS9_9MICO|nr:alpha/beta hydrolase [Microbacterium saperdae]TQL86466.1 alpha/beta hydrolase family protein [Microbacterium saperdae]GGM47829.1 alpha/beta hydrolase [Microbacterium saperdae]